jgi:transposase
MPLPQATIDLLRHRAGDPRNGGQAAAAAASRQLRYVLPRRSVVERTFSWFGRNRRLAKDFENLATTLETFVRLAAIQLAVRRLARAEMRV